MARMPFDPTDVPRGRVKLADACIEAEDEAAVLEVLRSGRLVAGPVVERFEAELARLTGRRHAVAVSSGTAALLAVMEALDVGPGSVVLVPALSFPAPAVVAAYLGATVRAFDVDPVTLNASERTMADRLDGGVSLVVAIDQFGSPAPVPAMEAASGGVPVIADAACSIGSTLDGRPCGSFGAAAAFSFHPRKVITTGEGGAVLTDDDGLAGRVRRFRNIGMGPDGFGAIGLNLRPSEIGAAIGLSQLGRLDRIIARRTALSARYRGLPLRFQGALPGATVNHQTLAAVLDEGRDRDGLIARLAAEGIEAQVASYCLGALPWLAARLGVRPEETPVALEAHRLGVALPLHEGLADAEVDRCARLVQDWLDD